MKTPTVSQVKVSRSNSFTGEIQGRTAISYGICQIALPNYADEFNARSNSAFQTYVRESILK